MDEKDNLELYEEFENKILKEVMELDEEDPKRNSKIDQLTKVSTIRKNYEDCERQRLDNNAKNDIKEQMLVMQEQRVKNDRMKIWVGVGQTLVGVGIGSFLKWKSYHMEEGGFSFKPVESFGDKLIEKIPWLNNLGR